MWHCWEMTWIHGRRISGCWRCALLCTAPTWVSRRRCWLPVFKQSLIMIIICMGTHCTVCPSGNPGKPLGFALNWSARITKEFFAQVSNMHRPVPMVVKCICSIFQAVHSKQQGLTFPHTAEQGDAEAAAGLPISRGCDRNNTDVAASQVRPA
jgi:3'5'-cyclic nucleotide phosphodiesterase